MGGTFISGNAEIEKNFCAIKHASELIRNTIDEDGLIHVFSHIDADGISAASIISKALFRLNAKFRVRTIQWIDEQILEEIKKNNPKLVIFTDLGSGYLDLLNKHLEEFKIIILDHHQLETGRETSFVHVNPHLNGIDGARDISGSGIAYFVAKSLSNINIDLSPIAIVGALGDMQDKYDQRSLGGLNAKILEDAIQTRLVKDEKDLIFFGRETRPIHKMLAYTTTPFIPGISGQEDKSLAFLISLNIKPKNIEKWRALRDLSKDEKKRLISALADHLLSQGLYQKVEDLIGHAYISIREEPWTPLRDLREFSVLLNATGRMDKPSLGIGVCMGERKNILEKANNVLMEYRKTLNKYVSWVLEKPERLKEQGNIYVINGENFIDDRIIGTIASILAGTLSNPKKPIIAYSNVEEQEILKFSARGSDWLIDNGVNLGEILQVTAETFSGKGGGHDIAAGAQIPKNHVQSFLKLVDEMVGKQCGKNRS